MIILKLPRLRRNRFVKLRRGSDMSELTFKNTNWL